MAVDTLACDLERHSLTNFQTLSETASLTKTRHFATEHKRLSGSSSVEWAKSKSRFEVRQRSAL